MRDVELDYLRAGHIAGPVETLAFIAANDEDIVLVNNNDLAFGDLAVVNLERGPPKGLEIVKSMLIQFCKVE